MDSEDREDSSLIENEVRMQINEMMDSVYVYDDNGEMTEHRIEAHKEDAPETEVLED